MRIRNFISMSRRDFLKLLEKPYFLDDFTKEIVRRVKEATNDYELEMAQLDLFIYMNKTYIERQKSEWEGGATRKDFEDDWAPEFFEDDWAHGGKI